MEEDEPVAILEVPDPVYCANPFTVRLRPDYGPVFPNCFLYGVALCCPTTPLLRGLPLDAKDMEDEEKDEFLRRLHGVWKISFVEASTVLLEHDMPPVIPSHSLVVCHDVDLLSFRNSGDHKRSSKLDPPRTERLLPRKGESDGLIYTDNLGGCFLQVDFDKGHLRYSDCQGNVYIWKGAGVDDPPRLRGSRHTKRAGDLRQPLMVEMADVSKRGKKSVKDVSFNFSKVEVGARSSRNSARSARNSARISPRLQELQFLSVGHSKSTKSSRSASSGPVSYRSITGQPKTSEGGVALEQRITRKSWKSDSSLGLSKKRIHLQWRQQA
jgi:hypothetical protein